MSKRKASIFSSRKARVFSLTVVLFAGLLVAMPFGPPREVFGTCFTPSPTTDVITEITVHDTGFDFPVLFDYVSPMSCVGSCGSCGSATTPDVLNITNGDFWVFEGVIRLLPDDPEEEMTLTFRKRAYVGPSKNIPKEVEDTISFVPDDVPAGGLVVFP